MVFKKKEVVQESNTQQNSECDGKYLYVFRPPNGTPWGNGRSKDVYCKPYETQTAKSLSAIQREIPRKNRRILLSGDALVMSQRTYDHYKDNSYSLTAIHTVVLKISDEDVQKRLGELKKSNLMEGDIVKNYIVPTADMLTPAEWVDGDEVFIGSAGNKSVVSDLATAS